MKETESFYKTKRWQRVRDYIYKRDKGLCQRCLNNGMIKGGEIVHHIKPIDINTMYQPEVAYNPENLILLCRECHGIVHKKKRRYKVNSDGTVAL